MLVSVIIPVKNQVKRIELCLDMVLSQIIIDSSFEVIVVDNGSTDGSYELLQTYDRICLLRETTGQSPYLARNSGIKKSSGDLIVFLDISCIPMSKSWLAEGINKINQGYDLVGGDVIFEFKNKSRAECFDSISNVKMRDSIETRGVAKGGNLFVRRAVFNEIGLWPDVRSGGDVSWTKRATLSGFLLGFSETAAVAYPARGFISLIKKSFRVGRGLYHIETNENKKRPSKLKYMIGSLMSFPSEEDLRSRIQKRGEIEFLQILISLRVIGYLCQISTAFGYLFPEKK